jgi:hypothetical protein
MKEKKNRYDHIKPRLETYPNSLEGRPDVPTIKHVMTKQVP